jgi:hypothetical protein
MASADKSVRHWFARNPELRFERMAMALQRIYCERRLLKWQRLRYELLVQPRHIVKWPRLRCDVLVETLERMPELDHMVYAVFEAQAHVAPRLSQISSEHAYELERRLPCTPQQRAHKSAVRCVIPLHTNLSSAKGDGGDALHD